MLCMEWIENSRLTPRHCLQKHLRGQGTHDVAMCEYDDAIELHQQVRSWFYPRGQWYAGTVLKKPQQLHRMARSKIV